PQEASAPSASKPKRSGRKVAAEPSPPPVDALPPASSRDDDEPLDNYDSRMSAEAAIALGSDRPAPEPWDGDEEKTVRGSSDLDSADRLTPPPSPTPPPPPGVMPQAPVPPPAPSPAFATRAAAPEAEQSPTNHEPAPA